MATKAPKRASKNPSPKTAAKKVSGKAKKKTSDRKKPERPKDGKQGGKGSGGPEPVTRPVATRRAPVPAPYVPGRRGGVVRTGDEDDLLPTGGGEGPYGGCGGRTLSCKLERSVCHQLGIAGVVHSHGPRHFEVRLEGGKVAAYAPMMVLRGRGREGKSVVIEAIETLDPQQTQILSKIVAFRAQYGQEYYVIFVGNDEVLDEVPVSAYDESCADTNMNTLVARLAE